MSRLENLERICDNVAYQYGDSAIGRVNTEFMMAQLDGEIEKDSPFYNKLRKDIEDIRRAFCKLGNDIRYRDK